MIVNNFLQILKYNLLKDNNRSIKYLFIFFGYFIVSSTIINNGLDLTDNGYHLANQMSAKKFGLNYISFIPVFWLSDVFAAYLSSLFNGWTLIEMRAVVLLLGFLQILILLRIQKNQNLELTYCGTFLLLLIGILMMIPLGFVFLSVDYYTVPTFFAYIFFYSIISFFSNPNIFKTAILSGLCFIILNLRVSTGIVISLIPILTIFIQYIIGKNYIYMKKNIILYITLIIVFLILEYLYFSEQEGIIDSILSNDWHNDKAQPGILLLCSGYIKQYFLELNKPNGLLLGFLIYFIYCLVRFVCFRAHKLGIGFTKRYSFFIKDTFLDTLNILPYFLSLAWIYMLFIYQNEIVTLPNVISWSYLFYFLLFVFFFINNSSFLSRYAALIVSGGIIPIAIFIGTNTGLIKIGYGLPILIFTIYFMLFNIPKKHKKSWLLFFFLFYFSYLSLILYKGKNQYYENVKISQIKELTYKMQNGKIKGIYTKPNSGKAIDDLLVQIEKFTKNKEKIFAFLTIPLIYYASDRENIIDDLPNFDIFTPPLVLERKMAKLCSSKLYTPEILVKSKKVVFDNNWETNIHIAKLILESNGWYENVNSIKINKIVEDNCKPRSIWENDYFQILLPQNIN